MAYPANKKMLKQLSCAKKVRSVQIRAQMKKMWSWFLLFSNFSQNIVAQVFKDKIQNCLFF